MTPDGPIWTEQETADFLKKTTRTLRAWRADGYGPPWYRPRGGIRYIGTEVMAWLREQSGEISRDRIGRALAAAPK